jgi:hypothetical protein
MVVQATIHRHGRRPGLTTNWRRDTLFGGDAICKSLVLIVAIGDFAVGFALLFRFYDTR